MLVWSISLHIMKLKYSNGEFAKKLLWKDEAANNTVIYPIQRGSRGLMDSEWDLYNGLMCSCNSKDIDICHFLCNEVSQPLQWRLLTNPLFKNKSFQTDRMRVENILQKLSKALYKRLQVAINGIVYTKMNILSPFIHPQVVPKLYECVCSAEHKGRYSEECGKRSITGAPFTSIVFFSYYGSQWCPKTAWSQSFFKISSFVFSRTKTFIQLWNYLRVNTWWQNFHFWVNYP